VLSAKRSGAGGSGNGSPCGRATSSSCAKNVCSIPRIARSGSVIRPEIIAAVLPAQAPGNLLLGVAQLEATGKSLRGERLLKRGARMGVEGSKGLGRQPLPRENPAGVLNPPLSGHPERSRGIQVYARLPGAAVEAEAAKLRGRGRSRGPE